MQNKTFIPLYLSIILFFGFTLNGCITYKPVQIKEIQSIEPANNDILSGKLIVNLRVANPNNYPIKVKKYDLNAFVNNTNLGRIEAGKKIVLKGNSDRSYQLTFVPDMHQVINILPSLVLKGSGVVALKGNVRIKSLFLSRTFSVDLKKKVSARDFR
ncbi:MAG TPA: LEA type 2 family protein [Cytophagales bacterium]|nr:LEA type 2 family protein [Cytophagales bacterium]